MLGKSVKHLRQHFVGYVALFVALGGTSFAAANALAPRNSVGSAQVINGSLQNVDLSRNAVATLRGARSPRGLRGAQGPPAALNLAYVELTSAHVVPASRSQMSAFIATGSTAAKCLVSANEFSAAAPQTSGDVYCARRNYNGDEGIAITVLLPDLAPADLVYVVTVYQEGASQYPPPVYYPPQ